MDLNDDLTKTKTYMRFQTGVATTVIEVKKNEYKGKESVVVTFQGEDGALLDGKFTLPFNEITKKQVEKLCKVAGASSIRELVGKKVGIQINKSEYNNKPYWNPSGFFPVSYLDSSHEGPKNDEADFNF